LPGEVSRLGENVFEETWKKNAEKQSVLDRYDWNHPKTNFESPVFGKPPK